MDLIEAKRLVIAANPNLDDASVERAARRIVNVDQMAEMEAVLKAESAKMELAAAQERQELAGLSIAELEAKMRASELRW